MPRPRRFGKLMNISMLECYFNMDGKRGHGKRFKGLKIEDRPIFRRHLKQYPVIRMNLKDTPGCTFFGQHVPVSFSAQ